MAKKKSAAVEVAVVELTPEQMEQSVESRLRGYIQDEVDQLKDLREEFLTSFEKSPAGAIQWRGAEVVTQESIVKSWEFLVLPPLEEEAPLVRRLEVILARVRRDQEQMIRRRPWEANSTSPFANVVQSARVSGQARVLDHITTVVDIALSQLRGRPESE